MRREDFVSDAPGMIVTIPRPLTSDELYAVATGAAPPPKYAHAFLPNLLPPELIYDAELVLPLVRASSALGRLDNLVQDLPNPSLLARPLLRREAVESSRIEGTIATLDDLVVFEETHQPKNRSQDDTREVANYLAALEYGLGQPRDRRISVGLIRELHQILLDGVRGHHFQPGTIRTNQNFIGGHDDNIDSARFVSPPPAEVPGLMSDLETYIANDSTVSPLIRIALVHYQFEAIHPFLDGNGRVGRLLIALLLRKWDVMEYPVVDLSAYVQRHRQTYVDGLLGVSQRGAWREWLDFFLWAMDEQGRDALRRAKRLVKLRDMYRRQLTMESRPERLNLLIDHLFENGTITIRRATELLSVTFPTAQSLINQLEHLGVLEEATGRKRGRIYRAKQVIAILDDRSGAPLLE
jgi:Fic family protein